MHGVEMRGDPGALGEAQRPLRCRGWWRVGDGCVGFRGHQALGRVEARWYETVDPGERDDAAEHPQRVGDDRLCEPALAALRGVLQGGYRRFGHADVSACVAICAGEFAVAPASSGGRQAESRGLGSLPERQRAPRLRADGPSRASLGAVGVARSSTDEREQPLVRHRVGDVADRGRQRDKPRQDIAREDPTHLVGTVGPGAAELVVGGDHPSLGDRSHVGNDSPGRQGLLGPRARGPRPFVCARHVPDAGEIRADAKNPRPRHVRNGEAEGSNGGGGALPLDGAQLASSGVERTTSYVGCGLNAAVTVVGCAGGDRLARARRLVVAAALLAACVVATSVSTSWGRAAAAPPGAARFEVIAPARLADTRLSDCTCTELDGDTIRVQIAGRAGVPIEATAAAVTVTVTGTQVSGYATVWPSGTARPETSVLNWAAGQTRANSAIVQLGASGAVDVYVFGSLDRADVIVDVTGAFVPVDSVTGVASAGRFEPLGALRRFDTRASGAPLAAGATVRIPLPDDVPADAIALVVNVTATSVNEGGHLTAFPAGGAQPGTSTVNTDAAGQDRAATTIVPVSPLGLDVFASSTTHVIVDVFGWFTGPTAPSGDDGLFVAVTPTRMFDTRPAPWPAIGDHVRELSADSLDAAALIGTIRSNASALVLNTTVTDATSAGYLTAFPARTFIPPTSSLNWRARETVANLTVSVNSTATIGFFLSVTTELIVDLTGYFTGTPIVATLPPPPSPPMAPALPGRLPPIDVTTEVISQFPEPFAAQSAHDAATHVIHGLRTRLIAQGISATVQTASLIGLSSEAPDAVALVMEVRLLEASGDDSTPGYDLAIIMNPDQPGTWVVTSASRQTICSRGITWADDPPTCI